MRIAGVEGIVKNNKTVSICSFCHSEVEGCDADRCPFCNSIWFNVLKYEDAEVEEV